jgi:hypothetical protein
VCTATSAPGTFTLAFSRAAKELKQMAITNARESKKQLKVEQMQRKKPKPRKEESLKIHFDDFI